MIQIVAVVAMLWLGGAYMMDDARNHERLNLELRADVEATNFMAYRDAVVAYLGANPTATGVINDTSLAFMPAYNRDPRWANVVSGGQLYVYATGAVKAETLNGVYKKSGRYQLVGTKANASLQSASGAAIAQVFPAAINDGALVFVGR